MQRCKINPSYLAPLPREPPPPQEIITQIYLSDGRVPERIGKRYESCYPYDSFAARDGSVVIAAANDKLQRLVCGTIGQPALADDERFDTNAKRVERHAEIKPLIEAWSRQHDVDDIVEAMLGAGVPASPINTIDRLVKDPHIAGAREMLFDIEHPVAGKTTLTGSHIKLGATPAHIAAPAPLLGQHGGAVDRARTMRRASWPPGPLPPARPPAKSSLLC
jgi:formyl-CoA transferase